MILKKGNRGEDVKKVQEFLHLQKDGIFGILTEEAVKEFQKVNNLPINGIVDDKIWAKLTENPSIKVSKRTINEIIIHCTATREGKNYTVDDIRRMHIARGFSDIGYHYLIYIDGSVHTGRDINIVGAHCTNHNAHSIGISYVGGLDSSGKIKDTRTTLQKDSLVKLIKQLKSLYPTAKVIGHRDTSPDLNGNGLIEPNEWIKACPCFDVKKEYNNI